MTVTAEANAALKRYGYNPDALAGGVSVRPGSSNATATWRGAEGTLLRYHVCYLDGIAVDGHEFSDLDPVSNTCLHCDYDLDDADRTWQWRQLFAWISHAVLSGANVNESVVRKKMRELDPTLRSERPDPPTVRSGRRTGGMTVSDPLRNGVFYRASSNIAPSSRSKISASITGPERTEPPDCDRCGEPNATRRTSEIPCLTCNDVPLCEGCFLWHREEAADGEI